MKAAFGNYTFALYSFGYFLEAMRRMEVQYIELWGAAPHFYIEDESWESAATLGREIRSRNLHLVCFTPEQCAYPINIASENRAMRERSIRYFEKAIEYAALLGAPAVLVTPGQGSRDKPARDALYRSIDGINHLARKARAAGIVLFLEHLTRATTNLIIRVKDMADYLSLVDDRKTVRGMADIDMMGRENEGIADYLSTMNSLPAHVHLVDGFPGGHLVPGDGVLPLVEETALLQREGYEGFLTLEVMHERYLYEPEQTVRNCSDWLEKQGISR
jgi:protein FrlC